MFKCNNCGAQYTIDDTVCPKCGHQLFDPRSSTVALQIDPNLLRLRRNRSAGDNGAEQATETARRERAVALVIRGIIERFIFEEGTEIILGRSDMLAATPGHFDLTHYGAHERGVSRNHALMRYMEDAITITDLNSANGTFVNTIKLDPHKPHALNEGDEVMLGSLSMVVRFEA